MPAGRPRREPDLKPPDLPVRADLDAMERSGRSSSARTAREACGGGDQHVLFAHLCLGLGLSARTGSLFGITVLGPIGLLRLISLHLLGLGRAGPRPRFALAHARLRLFIGVQATGPRQKPDGNGQMLGHQPFRCARRLARIRGHTQKIETRGARGSQAAPMRNCRGGFAQTIRRYQLSRKSRRPAAGEVLAHLVGQIEIELCVMNGKTFKPHIQRQTVSESRGDVLVLICRFIKRDHREPRRTVCVRSCHWSPRRRACGQLWLHCHRSAVLPCRG
jgi:hypothetical protein